MVGIQGDRNEKLSLSVTQTSLLSVKIWNCIDSYMDDLCKQECEV
jgi:hypothetical protein